MTDKKLRHIYWFAYYNLKSPSVRYRGKYPLDFAKAKLGIESHLVVPGYSPGRLINFIIAYFSALLFPKAGSIIVIQRLRSNFIFANLLKLLVKIRKSRFIYDLDDADYLEHDPKTIHFFARNCQCVSAGSHEIAKYVGHYNGCVSHITSPTPDFGIVKSERNKIFTIGWIGSFGWGHRDSLYRLIFPAVKKLPFACRLILIGVTKVTDEKGVREYFEDANHVELTLCNDVDWHDEKALQERIVEMDVGIATLLDHPLQLSKSGIKAKQYMNNGVPVLSNNLPENNNIVQDRHNGFLCDSPEEFALRMVQFKEMADEEYSRFSKNARLWASNFNHQKYLDEFKGLYVKAQSRV